MPIFALFIFAFAATGCDALIPIVELAKPAPDLPVIVQVARALGLCACFGALCWAAVRLWLGYPPKGGM